MDGPEEIARRFHDTYERLAPSFGYKTREDTKQFDPKSPNGKLMVAVCAEVLGFPTEDEFAEMGVHCGTFTAVIGEPGTGHSRLPRMTFVGESLEKVKAALKLGRLTVEAYEAELISHEGWYSTDWVEALDAFKKFK